MYWYVCVVLGIKPYSTTELYPRAAPLPAHTFFFYFLKKTGFY